MLTENTSIPADIADTITSVREECESLKKELEQAQEVWRRTHESEKQNFSDLLLHKESAWQEQEAEWARQKLAYEQRIEELKADFESRLKLTEQNAVRALNELEDAWQRDKLSWKPIPPVPESQPAQAITAPLELSRSEEAEKWAEEKQRLESRVLELEAQTTVVAAAPSAEIPESFVETMLHSLDYQIEVLFDLVQHHSELSNRQPLS